MFIKLDENQYSVVEELIYFAGYESVFAFAVTEKNIPGQIYVDDVTEPKSALICSHHGKYLVIGDETNCDFNSAVTQFLLEKNNHIQFYDLYASSEEWIDVLSSSLNGQPAILRFSVYYHNNAKALLNVEDNRPLENGLELKQIDEVLFEKIANEFDHSYRYHWTSALEFCAKSFGYCIIKDEEIISVASATYNGNGYAEIDIQTRDDYQRNGLAYKLCSKFIEYCAEKDYIILWICNSFNKPSNELVKKLGLIKSKEVEMLWWHQSKGVMNSYLNKYN
jgi:RimJ/RimL family protein N-acetyltransferase